jgi:glycosyltransferase involved in cell wall biosynthesis
VLHYGAVNGARVAVVVPCLDEADAVGKVVHDFRSVLPGARVLVVDNASRDATAARARAAGADVLYEPRRGKGYALRAGLRAAAPAEHVVMVDGDDTYPAEAVLRLLDAARKGADMVVAARRPTRGAFPAGHVLGNRVLALLVRVLFGVAPGDLLSGYRVLSRRFVESCPLAARGFEVDTELSLHAIARRLVVDHIPVAYRARAPGSRSKLRTFRDGLRILRAIVARFRRLRPVAVVELPANHNTVKSLDC